MKKNFCLLPLILLLAVACKQQQKEESQNKNAAGDEQQYMQKDVNFADWFAPKTIRLDYYHSGNVKEEHFGIDQVVADGEWPGSKTQLIDRLGLGAYCFEVSDAASHNLLFTRGFASIFAEWQSTPEADSLWGTFSESLRFPWPLKPVVITLKKRDAENHFKTLWTTSMDPNSLQIVQAERNNQLKTDVIFENGPASQKVDLVVLGDGYTQAEMGKFRADAKRLTDALFSNEPFLSHKKDFNVKAVETPAAVSGVTKPHHHVYKRSPLSVRYSAFGSERYALTSDNRIVRDVASAVPYDFMIILINEKTYGGGGIYNLYTTVSVDNKYSDYIMTHELGHHIAGLADEYYTSSVAYEQPKITVEPWETNITALFDKTKLKWKDLVDKDTPLPTPWNKEEFDAFGYKIQKTRDSIRAAQLPESVMEALFDKQKAQEDAYFSHEKYAGKVGAFEGGGYSQKGLYRPQLDCIMYTRHMQFCKVCSRSLVDVFGQYTK